MRRARLIATPAGNWCEGVTQTTPISFAEPVDAQAFAVQRNGHELRAGGAECRAQAGIAGILDRHARAPGRDQQAREEVEGLLRAGGDEDVVGAAGDGAREGDVPRHGGAQARVQGAAAPAARRGQVEVEREIWLHVYFLFWRNKGASRALE
jgi:hypothetical protein